MGRKKVIEGSEWDGGGGFVSFRFPLVWAFCLLFFFLCIKNDFTLFPTEVKCACTSFDDSA
jgi:hypothetical protein